MNDVFNKLLLDESPMVFQPTLAAWIGLNEAVALQQLNFKLRDVDGHKTGKIDENGVRWYRNSIREWQEKHFEFWDERTIKRTFDTLESDGLILSKVFKGRCKWYTINKTGVNSLDGPLPRMLAIKAKRQAAGKASKERNMTKCPNMDYDKVSQYNMTKCPTSKTPSETSILSLPKNLEPPALPEPITDKFYGSPIVDRALPEPIDPLAHIIATAQRGVSEANGPNPADQWFVYRDEFIAAYAAHLQGRYLSEAQKGDIDDYRRNYPNDTPNDFRKVLEECRHNWSGRGPCPWARIMEVRAAGGTWTQWKAATFKDKQKGQADNGQQPTKANGSTLTPAQMQRYKELERSGT